MKRTCYGCKALFISNCDSSCSLDKKYDINKFVPLEECGKPKTNKELVRLLKEMREEAQKR
jgi:hypothetical protein